MGTAAKTPKAGGDKAPKATMSMQMRNARAKYEPTVSYTNRLSLNNGDDVAKLLAGATPAAVMTAAEIVCGLEVGELAAKYEHLNKGQQRMNAGNRIRGAVKKGTTDASKLAKALGK